MVLEDNVVELGTQEAKVVDVPVPFDELMGNGDLMHFALERARDYGR